MVVRAALGRRWGAALLGVALACSVVLSGCALWARPLSGDSVSRADAAAGALQQAYYMNGRWRGAGYWQNAQGLWVVLDQYQRTHAQVWKVDIAQVYKANSQHGRIGNYLSDYVDDEGWWALDWIRAWDLTGDAGYLKTAEATFADMASTWGGTCGGGVWWNHKKTYKNAIPNELFLLTAVELHERVPGDTAYLGWAEKEATWFQQSGMINGQGLVNDGLGVTCLNNGGNPWTYNQGVILAGLAELGQVTGNAADLALARRIGDAAVAHLVTPEGVLYERGCEPGGSCGGDGALFKGIFVRYLWWLYRYAPEPQYKQLLAVSTEAIWTKDRGAEGTFGLHWSGPPTALVTVQGNISAVMALTSTATELPTVARRV